MWVLLFSPVAHVLFPHYFTHHYNTTNLGWKQNLVFSAFTLHNTYTSVCAQSSLVHGAFLYLFGTSPFKFSALISTPPFRGHDPDCWSPVLLLTVFWVAVTASAAALEVKPWGMTKQGPHCMLRLSIPQNYVSTGATALTCISKMAKVLPMTHSSIIFLCIG